jgi:hypothetical protein
MTKRRTPNRLSRPALRAWAWVFGAVALALPWVALERSAEPASAAAPHAPWKPRSILVRHVIRRVIVIDPVTQQPVSVPVQVIPGSSSGGGTAPAPAPAPVSTGGS